MRKAKRRPVVGCAFDPDQRNEIGNIEAYISELEFYRPRGFSKLKKEGERYVALLDRERFDDVYSSEWMQECDHLLTEWARRVERHDYIGFGPFEHGGAVGFYNHVEGAFEDADLKVDDTGEVPRGFTGLVCRVSDHGNVTVYRCSRGRFRELFSVV